MKTNIFYILFILFASSSIAQIPPRNPNESTKDFTNRVFPVGTRVLAKFVNKQTNIVLKYWYYGTIISIAASGDKVTIKYDDGDKQEVPVRSERLQPNITFSSLSTSIQSSYQGKKVIARFYDSGYNKKFWYKGYANIVKAGTSVYVVYDDGDKKTHTNLESICVYIDY